MKRKIEYGPNFQRLNSHWAETYAFMEYKTRIQTDTTAQEQHKGLNIKGLLFANCESLASKESRKGRYQLAFSLSVCSTKMRRPGPGGRMSVPGEQPRWRKCPKTYSTQRQQNSLLWSSSGSSKETSFHLGPLRRESQAEEIT